jgi:hypothetical protein
MPGVPRGPRRELGPGGTNFHHGYESPSPFLQEDTMRSELIFGAMTYVPNRFLLTILAAKTTRKLHRPRTRIEDTANDVLKRFTHSNPLPRVRLSIRKAA